MIHLTSVFRLTPLLALMISQKTVGQPVKEKGLLILVSDSATGAYGYRNETGKIIIPMGKYLSCFTDTFRSYAIVDKPGEGIVGIDRQGRVLYSIFIFDNGPDEPSDGLFRIKTAGKIGYADSATGEIVIKPQYACAWPFENGMAKVAAECKTRSDGEHSTWISDHWFFINKNGVRVNPATNN
jgi:hypothetical protein